MVARPDGRERQRWAPLLHHDGHRPGIERAGREQRAHGVPRQLPGHVVDVGLDDHVAFCIRLGARGTEHGAQQVRAIRQLALSAAPPDSFGGERGPALESLGDDATMAAPVGVTSSASSATA